MKRKNATRTALFTSIISLLLCVSMLVGTTFAWFTDEVQSGRNTIAAGNLDVELYHGKTTEFTDDDKVKGDTVLFDDVDPNLWEPGALAYENLQVANVGSLALQYTLTLDVLNETVVNGYKLSDVIMVGVVEKGVTATTREDIIKAVNGNWTALKNFKLDQTAVKLKAGDSTDAFGVVLYWAPNDNEVDNRYNMNNENRGEVLKLDIGVTLMATQVMHENDSFGDDYDGEATPWIGAINTDWYFANPDAAEFTINTVDELAGLAAIVNGTAVAPVTTFAAEGESETVQNSFAGKTVKLGDNIDLANATWTPIGNGTYAFKGTFDGQDKTISNLKVTGNGSNVGLFGNTNSGAIKDLTVKNATVTGRLNVGVVAGQPYTSTYSNITVAGHVEVNGMSYVGGVGGKNAYANWDNITVNVDETSYVKANSLEKGTAYRTYVGGVIGFMGEGGHKVSNVTSNIDVIGDVCDIGGIVGIAHYGNTFENVTCSGNVRSTSDADELGGIAGVWNNGGADVTFTNCKFTGTVSDKNGNVDGCDIVGGFYSATGNGKLNIDGVITSVVKPADLVETVNSAENGATVYVGGGESNLPSMINKEGLTIIGAADGSTVIGGENAATGFGSNFGKDTTIKNVTFSGSSNGVRYSYANGGISTFENCTFAGDYTYGFHIDQSNGATFIFNNCTFVGFNAFAGDLLKVTFNNCTFLSNGNYGHTNIWSIGEFNNCTWGDKTSVSPGSGGGDLFFNGVQESYHHEFVGSAESLVAFAESVNEGGDSWDGQKVVLVADIDLENNAWSPIGQTGATTFSGSFDGQGYTISNLTVDSSAQTGANYSSGLFGWIEIHGSDYTVIEM